MTEADLIEKVRKNREKGRSKREEYKTEWDQCYDYYEGDQVPSGLPSYAKYFALNLIRKRLDSILGAMLRFKYTISLKPRGEEDIGKADFYKKVISYLMERAKAWMEIVKAICQQYTVGIGWMQLYWDRDKNQGLGGLAWQPRDAYTVWFDPAAKEENLSDARWIGREERFTLDEVKLLWPEKADLVTSNDPDTLDPTNEIDNDKVTVIEYQYYTEKKVKKYFLDGEAVEPPKGKKVPSKYQVISKTERTYYKAQLAGEVVLNNSGTGLSQFDMIPFYHSKRKDSPYPIGEIKNWIKWQDLINVMYSLMIDYVGRSAKITGVIKGASGQEAEQLRRSAAEPGAMPSLPEGVEFQSVTPAPLPASFDMVLKDLRTAWDDLTAYYQVQRGDSPWSGISGKAIKQLQSAGSLAYVLGEHHINDSITACGRLMLELIGKHMTVEQALRITEEGEPVPINKFMGKEGEISEQEIEKQGLNKVENPETNEVEYYLNSLSEIANYDLKIEVDSLKEQTQREKEEMALALVKTKAEDGRPLVDREYVLDAVEIKEKDRILARMAMADQVAMLGKMVMSNPFLMELVQNPDLLQRVTEAMGQPQGVM